jgi:hypothetical protein
MNKNILRLSKNQKVKVIKLKQSWEKPNKNYHNWTLDLRNKKIKCKLRFKWRKIKLSIIYKKYKISNNLMQG